MNERDIMALVDFIMEHSADGREAIENAVSDFAADIYGKAFAGGVMKAQDVAEQRIREIENQAKDAAMLVRAECDELAGDNLPF